MKKSTNMRVLIIGPYPPPFGGIASHITSLIPDSKERGWDDLAIVSFSAANAVEKMEGATIYRYNIKKNAHLLLYPSNWLYLFKTFICLFNSKLGFNGLLKEATKAMLTCKIANNHRSEVVSLYQADLSLMLIPCSKIWEGSKHIVLTVLGEIYDSFEYFKKRAKVFDRLLSIPNHVLASSQHCADSFAKIGVKRHINTVYFGIETERFKTSPEMRDKFRAELGIGKDEILVFYMGRFNQEMGLNSVVDAAKDILSRYKKSGKTIKFLLAGAKGPISDMPQQLSKEYPGFIHIMNDVSFSIQPAMYAGCDMVLAPTRDQHACMGMSIKEAMATGRAVIASISGGIPEAIIHDNNGILIPLDKNNSVEHDKFRDAILYLAENETVRTRFGEEGRKRAEEIFTAKITIQKYGSFFQSS